MKELDKAQNIEGETSVVYLRYANAEEILPILQNIENTTNEAPDSSTENIKTSIQADESTNSIIITASIASTNNIKNVIRLLDIRKAQVLIEAIIVELSSNDANELGVQWLTKGTNGIGLTNFNGAIPSLLSAATGNTLDVANALNQGASFALGSFESTNNEGFGGILNALAGSGKANILSTPSVVTLDNEKATIMVGQEVPFITNTEIKSVGSNPFQNFERKDVGLTLIVRPQINEGDTIKLNIDQEISNILPGSNASDLVTSKRRINTSVMVSNNKILVLGGLMDDTVVESESKVPGFGDVPILGDFFKYKTKKLEKRNLLIFIRPTILTDQTKANDVSSQKYNYIRAQQLLDKIDANSDQSFNSTNSDDIELPLWMDYE